MGVAENANALASTPEMFQPIPRPPSNNAKRRVRMQTPSLSRQAVLQSPSARQGCPVPYFSVGHTKTLDGQQHVRRAHQDTEQGPQDHSLEDLLVRSEESPCENTDAPRVPAKFSSQTPTEIVSPIVSPASEAISQKLCFQPKSKVASAHNEADADKVSATPISSAGRTKTLDGQRHVLSSASRYVDESLRTIASKTCL